MRAAVRAAARLFPTAIISGRGREKVESFVQLKELYYAGSHGMDIVGPRVHPSPKPCSARSLWPATAAFSEYASTAARRNYAHIGLTLTRHKDAACRRI